MYIFIQKSKTLSTEIYVQHFYHTVLALAALLKLQNHEMLIPDHGLTDII